MNIADLEQLRRLFADNRNDVLAGKMKGYMRNQFEFYGIQTPLRRELTKKFLDEYGFPQEDQVFEVIAKLWNMEERELACVALQIMDMRKRKFHLDDIKLIEYMTIHKSWWDTVDHIASNHAGHYFNKFPEQRGIADEWIRSNNLWLQRSAILFQLKYKQETDMERLFHYITLTADSNEFFIQKAIGWSLRQYSKYNPDAVINFVESNSLANLSKREALKVIQRTT